MMKDTITVYEDEGGEYRWTRMTTPGREVIGAATEGYRNKEDALANIERTQGGEFTLIDVTAKDA